MNKLFAIAAIAAVSVATPAFAQNPPIANPAGAGAPVLANGGNVTATYLGTSAAYTSELYFVRGGGLDDVLLFNNHPDPVTGPANTPVDLGSFAAGTELLFRLHVLDTDEDFFSGTASRNSDGQAHAAVQSNYGALGTTLVSFEDLRNGPFDYNDLSFSFSGTLAGGVPEPATWALMILGFGGVAGAMRTRSRKVAFAAA